VETFLQSNQSEIYACLFFGTFAIIALWEQFAPRRKLNASLHVRWYNNFGLILINTALLWLIYPGFGIGSSLIAADQGWGLLRIYELPYWLTFVMAIALMDIGHYSIHYLFHHVPSLWRLHRLHHTDHDFDLTTSVRFHPGEAVLEHGANLAVIFILGPPVLAVTLFSFSYVLTTAWVHGNIRMPGNWDRKLRLVFVTPDMHRTHHSQINRETNSNYGGLFSLWDRLFGNYTDEPAAGHAGMKIGLKEFQEERHIRLWPMLANPFLDPVHSLNVAAAANPQAGVDSLLDEKPGNQ
jgi:sterol desaturase/sphingolipid hydroxylase (fatty acid hydroxylase superfamily)